MGRKLDLSVGQIITMTPTVANVMTSRNPGLVLERVGITQYKVISLPRP